MDNQLFFNVILKSSIIIANVSPKHNSSNAIKENSFKIYGISRGNRIRKSLFQIKNKIIINPTSIEKVLEVIKLRRLFFIIS